MITYRTMRYEDIPAALSLCRHAHWNQVARDWELFLRLSPAGCRVAEQNQVVGSVSTVRYQDHFSWIGMLLVDPAHERQGIGMQLLREALQILYNEETVKLDATPAGREVYLKMNFADEYRLARMKCISCPAKLPDSPARAIRKDELSRLLEFDVEAFGANRSPVLAWLLDGAPECAFLVEDKKGVQGFCFGRPGEHHVHIGPVIANSADVAHELVLAALNRCAGRSAIIDISLTDPSWMEWLASIGFGEERPFFRMVRGANRFPGVRQKQFAIVGPEFG